MLPSRGHPYLAPPLALIPNLFFPAFKLKDDLFTLVPVLVLTLALNPSIFFCLVIMLIIPASPSASYLAPGLVMTSIVLICSAGIVCKTSDILS